MGKETNISWTDSTNNLLYGCLRISAGCEKCYAEEVVAGLARKFKTTNPRAFAFYDGLTRETANGPRWTGTIKIHREHLLDPPKWLEPRRIFANSLSDLFHDKVERAWLVDIFAMFALCHWHTFQVLTKRPERMRAIMSEPTFRDDVLFGAGILNASHRYEKHPRLGKNHPGNLTWPLPNVWLGVTTEDQKAADERIPLLLATPAAERFLSAEPLLGPINLERYLVEPMRCTACGHMGIYYDPIGLHQDPAKEYPTCVMGAPLTGEPGAERCMQCKSFAVEGAPRPSWVIVGGESGATYRPMNAEWARGIKEQCVANGVAFFYKQGAGVRSGQTPWLTETDGGKWRWHQFPGIMTPPVKVLDV